MRLYAQWEEISGDYLLYMGNGGTTSDGANYYYQYVDGYTDVQLLDKNLFSKSGYCFIGWKDSSGNWYKENQICSFEGSITLTAQWGYARINYHKNSPDGSLADTVTTQYITSQYGEIKNSSTYSISGYSFIGWNTEPDGSGEWYSAEKEISEPIGAIELYAQWIETPENYIRYSSDGTDALSGKTYQYIEIDEFPSSVILPNITGTDYEYIGWSNGSSWSGSKKYAPNDTYEVTQNTTMYAYYVSRAGSQINYTSIYYGNGGTATNGSTVATKAVSNHNLSTYDSFALLDRDAFKNDGKHLKSWNTKADGTGITYGLGELVDRNDFSNKVMRLYAQWGKNIYEVTYDANGGTNAPASQLKKYNEELMLSAIVPTKHGYIFKGWVTKEKVKVEQTVSVEGIESTHNYEHNTNKTWTISSEGAEYIVISFDTRTELENSYDKLYIYNCNGEKIGTYTGSELSGKSITVIGDTVKLNLVTDGSVNRWGFKLTSATAGSTENAVYTPGAILDLNMDITLCAVWQHIKTQTAVIKQSSNVFCNVSLVEIPKASILWVAGFKDGRLVCNENRSVTSDTESFTFVDKLDEIRVFVFEDITSIKPITECEIILVE